MALCRRAGLSVVACGSGPGFFASGPPSRLPAWLFLELEQLGLPPITARSLDRATATAIRQV
jgi:hypothetical protein